MRAERNLETPWPASLEAFRKLSMGRSLAWQLLSCVERSKLNLQKYTIRYLTKTRLITTSSLQAYAPHITIYNLLASYLCNPNTQRTLRFRLKPRRKKESLE